MKILHVINTLAIGGAETLVTDMAIEMSSTHEVTVLVLGGEDSFLTTRLEKERVSVIKLTTKIKSFQNFLWLKKNMNKYDVIHAHLSWAQYFVSIGKIFNKDLKIFTTEHSTNNRRRNSKILKIMDFCIYSCYDGIIVINEEVKKSLISWQPRMKSKVKTISNGINLEKFRNAKPISRPFDKKIIIMVAGFREAKDHDTLIDAMKYLSDDYILWIVGEGVRRNEIEVKISKHNLVHKVHLLGLRSDVENIIKASDVFVLSSHWEGQPLCVIEAMAAKVPVIGSKVRGLTETIGEAGILFNHQDDRQLAEKIELLCSNETLYNEYIDKGFKKSFKYDLRANCIEYLMFYQQ
ncbi:MAG: glycosyltransferase [Culicoidibacterales bacterium]